MAECRRASSRVPVDLRAAIVFAEAESECALTNLSVGGAQIQKPFALAMSDRVRLTFSLPGLAETIDTVSTVRWVTSELIGVQFDGLRAREVWALSQFLKGMERAAS